MPELSLSCPHDCPCERQKQGIHSQQQPTRLIRELKETEGFTRKNEDGREADSRLDTMQGATVRGMVATLHADLTQRGGVMMQTMTRGHEV